MGAKCGLREGYVFSNVTRFASTSTIVFSICCLLFKRSKDEIYYKIKFEENLMVK